MQANFEIHVKSHKSFQRSRKSSAGELQIQQKESRRLWRFCWNITVCSRCIKSSKTLLTVKTATVMVGRLHLSQLKWSRYAPGHSSRHAVSESRRVHKSLPCFPQRISLMLCRDLPATHALLDMSEAIMMRAPATDYTCQELYLFSSQRGRSKHLIPGNTSQYYCCWLGMFKNPLKAVVFDPCACHSQLSWRSVIWTNLTAPTFSLSVVRCSLVQATAWDLKSTPLLRVTFMIVALRREQVKVYWLYHLSRLT